jgi:mannose-6-phosphate isomerase-like protein (cupin superfamily)
MAEEKELPLIAADDRPFYEKWQEEEGLDIVGGMFIEDLRKVPLKPWKRKGGLGVFVNLEGRGPENDAYICEIPPGGALLPQKHLFEETLFILEGRGSTSIWSEGGTKQSFEWQPNSHFSPPLNTWHQHFNAQGNKPARYVAMTLAPLMMNVFHNRDFIFNNPFQFTDRYSGKKNYFSAEGKLCKTRIWGSRVWETNFIPDVLKSYMSEWKERGAGGKSVSFELAENSMASHISEFPVGTYKKAHRHGPGAHVIIVSGEGYSLLWEKQGKPIQRYDWKVGSMFVPPTMWFHQHFNVGKEPARYFVLSRRISVKHNPGGDKDWDLSKSDKSLKVGGNQIEYEDEDPMIREMFEKELAKRGVECKMPKIR